MNKKEIYTVRKQWIDIITESSKQYDKSILFVSSGAIAISLTFIANIIDKAATSSKWLILCAWAGFGLSMAVNLVSFLTSQKGYLENIKQLDSGELPNRFWTICTWWLNIAAFISLFTGAVFLCWFTYINIGQK